MSIHASIKGANIGDPIIIRRSNSCFRHFLIHVREAMETIRLNVQFRYHAFHLRVSTNSRYAYPVNKHSYATLRLRVLCKEEGIQRVCPGRVVTFNIVRQCPIRNSISTYAVNSTCARNYMASANSHVQYNRNEEDRTRRMEGVLSRICFFGFYFSCVNRYRQYFYYNAYECCLRFLRIGCFRAIKFYAHSYVSDGTCTRWNSSAPCCFFRLTCWLILCTNVAQVEFCKCILDPSYWNAPADRSIAGLHLLQRRYGGAFEFTWGGMALSFIRVAGRRFVRFGSSGLYCCCFGRRRRELQVLHESLRVGW